MKEKKFTIYSEAEAFLNDVPRFTKKNPLQETQGFYEYIQNYNNGEFAENRLGKIIHVAGTNGKGSVCAFLNQICIESGYHVGMFTSPHLITTRERFSIDGEMVSEETFVEAYNWLSDRIMEYQGIKADYSPTYFERLFFMGIYLFVRAGVEILILETGLGGRLDTTNVIKEPVITIITEVGLDHTEYLGDTLEEIANEKAGIIKPKVPVVFVNRKSVVSEVFREKCSDYGCEYQAVSENEYKINEKRKKSIDFSLRNLYYCYGGFVVNTTALYQVENAALAVRACDILMKKGILDKLTVDTVREGISKMKWSGRMEEIIPGVYIDGAHNIDGIEAFADILEGSDFSDTGNCILIFSAVRDKRYEEMIKRLCQLPMITDYVITQIPGERGTSLEELRCKFELYTDKSIHSYEDIKAAIRYAVASREENGVVYIVGSLYLAGIVMEENYDKF